MSQAGYTPISLYFSTTAAAVPTSANLVAGELAINTLDGKLYYKNSAGTVTLLASTSGASGDVVGPASATDNALARFDLTTGKLIQNSVGILSDAGILTGLTGLTSSGSITLSSLTSGRVTYAGASGLLSDNTNFVWDNTNERLGVGISTPVYKLHVNTTFDHIHMTNPTTGTTGSDGFTLDVFGTSARLIQRESASMEFYTASTQRMTILSTGEVGIGTSSPDAQLDVTRSGNGQIAVLQTSANRGFSFDSQSNTALQIASIQGSTNMDLWADTLSFSAGATERMRITSAGNVGIGTSSPSGKLQIDSANVDPSATATGITLINSTSSQATNNGGSISLGGVYTGSSITQFGYILGAKANSTDGNYAGYLSFGTRPNGDVSQERMRLDSAGNLGLGVTPSAWRTTDRALEIGSVGKGLSAPTSGNSVFLATNWYVNTTPANVYAANGYASRYAQSDGTHIWSTAPSNSSGAGAALTFAEGMRLDASGNLGVGTSSPGSYAADADNLVLASSGNTGMTIKSGATSTGNLYFANAENSTSNNGVIEVDHNVLAMSFNIYGTGRSFRFKSAGTEVMRIDSSGNVGIGTSSPAGKLHVMKTATGGSPQNPAGNQIVMENGDSSGSADLQFLSANNGYNHIFFGDAADANIGTLLYDHNDNSMQFVTNTAERARITSGGDFYVGTTTGTIGTGNFGVVNAQDGGIFASRNEDGSVVVFQVGGNVGLLRVLGNGNAQNTNNSYGAISDVKLKENIVDATPKLADLMQVKVRNYNMIGDTTKQIGVVAQELETVFPSMIDVTLDKDAEGNDLGTTTKAVKYSVFVPMLIKAIQEQQALIESLTTRLTALETA